jgi:drug/metabolite transporter (DMT)-like permease
MASTIVCVWGAAFIFAKFAMTQIPPMTLAFVRFALATPVLIAITGRTRSSRESIKLALRKDFWSFSILALSGITLQFVLEFYSLRFISATQGSIIMNLQAIFAMLLSAVFLKEALTTRKVAGVFIAFSGVIVITIRNVTLTSLSFIDPIGVLVMVGAALCWATYSVYGKNVLQRYSNEIATSCAFLLGTLYLVPFALSENKMGALLNLSWLTWFSIFFLAIPSSVVAYVIWNHLIRAIDVTKVLVTLYIVPIPTAIMSYLLLGETFTYYMVLGAILVIVGIYLTESSKTNSNV